jgi:hypothetical protein
MLLLLSAPQLYTAHVPQCYPPINPGLPRGSTPSIEYVSCLRIFYFIQPLLFYFAEVSSYTTINA